MGRTRGWTGVGALAIGLAACLGVPDPSADLEPQPDEEIILHVENRNFHRATLYAVDGGWRLRLGAVEGIGRRTFRFRWDQAVLRIEIDFLSAGVYATPSMSVERGDVLDLVIEQNLDRLIPIRRPG